MVARKNLLRYLIPLVVVGVAAVLFRHELHFIGPAVAAVRSAHPTGVLVAFVATLASFYAMAEVMVRLLRAGGVHVPRGQANALVVAANAWSATLPGGAAFSAVLTFQVQRRWGARVALCSWFFVVSSALSTGWLVVLGLIAALFMGAAINVVSLLASLGGVVAMGFALYWVMRHTAQMQWLAGQVVRVLCRVLRRDPAGWLRAVEAALETFNTVRITPWQFALATLWSLLNRVLDVATLAACAWAVTGSIPLLEPEHNNTTLAGVLLAFVGAKVAGSVQATPGGLGTVDAALVATLVATGMTSILATTTAILYRLITLIVMAAIGWVVYAVVFARHGFRTVEVSDLN